MSQYGFPSLRPTIVTDAPIDEYAVKIGPRLSTPATQDSVRSIMARGWETYTPHVRRFRHDGV